MSGSVLSITSLPTELIHEIAWLSSNPNLYLVSQEFRLILCPQRDFMQDLALLLLCNRQSPESGWYATAVPWKTSSARRWDFSLDTDERELLQKQIFDLEYINAGRLVSMIRFLLRIWVDINYPYQNILPSRQLKRLQTYLTSAGDACLRSDVPNPISCNKDHLVVDENRNHKLILSNNSGMSVSFGDEPYNPTKYVVHMLYIPTRLLKVDKDPDCEDLSKTLLFRTKMDSLNHLIVKKHTATAKPRWMSG